MYLIQKWKNIFIQFIKFGIVGLINTILTYLIYFIAIRVGVYYLVANFLAFVITVFISYLLNNRFVFVSRNSGSWKWIKGLIKVYISYASTTLLLSTLLLWVQVEIFGIWEELAPILNLFITVPLNFILNKFWVYKNKE